MVRTPEFHQDENRRLALQFGSLSVLFTTIGRKLSCGQEFWGVRSTNLHNSDLITGAGSLRMPLVRSGKPPGRHGAETL